MAVMLLLGQLETGLQLMDRYGFTAVAAGIMAMGGWYVLRRLLHEEKGLLTGYITSTQDQQKHLADTVRLQADTDSRMADVLESANEQLANINDTVKRLENANMDPHSPFATVTLINCFRHGCDVLQHISQQLDIDEKTEPHITMMRRELDHHGHLGGN